MMKIRQLLANDDAVSPVIGVILMVAITVILAAVIGTFVLGIGQDQQTTPSASFDFDYDSGSGELVISHSGGDSFSSDNSASVTIDTPYSCSSGTPGNNAWLGSTDPIGAGSTYYIYEATNTVSSPSTPNCVLGSDFSTGDTVRIIWTGPGGSKTQTVATFNIA